MSVVPYKEKQEGKKEQVAEMFNNISKKYDFLNHLLSLGIDITWRKKAIKLLQKDKPRLILDIATGTGDFAIEALALHPDKVIGVDISAGMLEEGKKKMKKRNLDHIIDLQMGDSEKLLFEDNKFDAVIVSFGVRNFQNLEKGLSEINRVLKKGGKLVVLEFSKPEQEWLSKVYDLYSFKLLPTIGQLVANDKESYQYLAESIRMHPDQETLKSMMQDAGFAEVSYHNLTGGIVALHRGYKF